MAEMRRIAPERLHPDPDVQLDWAFNPKWIKARMAEGGFSEDKAGMIDVTPNGGDGYNVFWGRHRAALALESGHGPIRCLVHDEMSVAEKHAIKLAKDRDQRRVRAVETFLNEVGAGEEEAVAINEVVEMNGRKVGKRASKLSDFQIIESVRSLEGIYRDGGAELLNAVFEFSDSVPEWVGAPGTNEGYWLDGVTHAVKDGWPSRLTPASRAKLGSLTPRAAIKHAQGEATLADYAQRYAITAKFISEKLRKHSGVRATPKRKAQEEDQA